MATQEKSSNNALAEATAPDEVAFLNHQAHTYSAAGELDSLLWGTVGMARFIAAELND